MDTADAPPGMSVRRLVRAAFKAALGTVMRANGDAEEGAPYVSLVLVAADLDGAPLLLLSDLADHSRNLAIDDRASLLLDGTEGRDDPLAHERATLVGRLLRDDEPRLKRRYLARHPEARAYAEFGDFHVYRMHTARAHLVAGFGRIHWLDAADIAIESDAVGDLAAAEADILEHMNGDHRDAVQLYATALLRREHGDWRATGIDPDGLDLRRGRETTRLPFSRTVLDAADARGELVRLARQARDLAPPDRSRPEGGSREPPARPAVEPEHGLLTPK